MFTINALKSWCRGLGWGVEGTDYTIDRHKDCTAIEIMPKCQRATAIKCSIKMTDDT